MFVPRWAAWPRRSSVTASRVFRSRRVSMVEMSTLFRLDEADPRLTVI